MQTVKIASFITGSAAAFIWLINRACPLGIYITKTDLGFVAHTHTDQAIGMSSKPYYSLNRGFFSDTFTFGGGKFTTFKRITNVNRHW